MPPMTTTKPNQAILDQVRAEGYQEGKADAQQMAAQYRMMDRDEVYMKGFYEAWGKSPSRFRWWLFGLICGLLPMFWSIVT